MSGKVSNRFQPALALNFRIKAHSEGPGEGPAGEVHVPNRRTLDSTPVRKGSMSTARPLAHHAESRPGHR